MSIGNGFIICAEPQDIWVPQTYGILHLNTDTSEWQLIRKLEYYLSQYIVLVHLSVYRTSTS